MSGRVWGRRGVEAFRVCLEARVLEANVASGRLLLTLRPEPIELLRDGLTARRPAQKAWLRKQPFAHTRGRVPAGSAAVGARARTAADRGVVALRRASGRVVRASGALSELPRTFHSAGSLREGAVVRVESFGVIVNVGAKATALPSP